MGAASPNLSPGGRDGVQGYGGDLDAELVHLHHFTDIGVSGVRGDLDGDCVLPCDVVPGVAGPLQELDGFDQALPQLSFLSFHHPLHECQGGQSQLLLDLLVYLPHHPVVVPVGEGRRPGAEFFLRLVDWFLVTDPLP